MKIQSFPSLSNPKAEVLLLGTMPGVKSLELNQYYGHPQNLFWKLLSTIFDQPFSNDYNIKKEILLQNNIAVWDVLQICERPGSLDSAIKKEVPNDFEAFLNEHPNIKLIAFNGQKAAAFFKKYVQLDKDYVFITLPSTSPANAGKNFDQKLKEWQIIKEYISVPSKNGI